MSDLDRYIPFGLSAFRVFWSFCVPDRVSITYNRELKEAYLACILLLGI